MGHKGIRMVTDTVSTRMLRLYDRPQHDNYGVPHSLCVHLVCLVEWNLLLMRVVIEGKKRAAELQNLCSPLLICAWGYISCYKLSTKLSTVIAGNVGARFRRGRRMHGMKKDELSGSTASFFFYTVHLEFNNYRRAMLNLCSTL